MRDAVAQGRADYTPISISEIEGLLDSGALPVDVALIQTVLPTPMASSVSASASTAPDRRPYARIVIAEVNQQMPRTSAKSSSHISKFAAVVETSRALLELGPEPSTAIQQRIAAMSPD